MMLNDFHPNDQQLNTEIDDENAGLLARMNSTLHSISEVVSQNLNSSDTSINILSTSNNSSSSSSNNDQQTEQIQAHNSHPQEQFEISQQQQIQHHHYQQQHLHQQLLHQRHQQDQSQLSFFSVEPLNNHNNSRSTNNKFNLILNSSTSSPSTSSEKLVAIQPSSSIGNMNVQQSNMIPTAHGSEHQIQYSLPANKSLSDTSSSNMALNFSHDLLQHSSQHSQSGIQNDSIVDTKSHLNNNMFELDSGLSAVNMNIWKNPMSLNHFKHPAMHEHNFLPNADLNTFSNWTHGSNLSNQTHHILDGQHLIGYQQHQRSIPLPTQDLVGASLKGQSNADQTPFMLNSINQHASTSHNPSSNHQSTQPVDNLNLRSHQLDHNASYNLSVNDGQFYNNSRSDSRSHPVTLRSSLMVADRSAHMSLGGNQGHLTYHSSNDTSLQPTTSHQNAGSSSGSISKGSGSFKCQTCHEVFPLRTVYLSHLKTHSQDKGTKAKFSCELCGHSFSQKTSLNRHMKSHTGERPFPCEICAKAFSEKERLKIHMRTHTGEKPFSCGTCGKSFSQKSTVKRHQTVHTGEKKFRCDCGKGFANRGNLIAHIKTRGSNHFE